jgi:hypothetical protein
MGKRKELARSDNSAVDLTGDVEDTPGGPDVLPPRQLALQYGRTPQTTTGEGDCLYHAVAAEATRVDTDLPPKSERNEATRAKRARKRNMANGFWRPAASDCARQDFVQSLMNGRDEEWRSGRSQTPRDPASYPDYIRAPSVWGNTFDVALLAWCIEHMQRRLQPDSRSRLVVFSRDGVHVQHAVGTNGRLCAKTRLLHGEVKGSDICIGIDGCHWWSAPPSNI